MKKENLGVLVNVIKSFTGGVIPILDGVKIKDGVVTVTNLGVMVEITMGMDQTGVVNKELFCSAITSIDDVKIKVDEKGNYLFYNAFEKLKIGGYDIEDYPDPMIKEKDKKIVLGKLGDEELRKIMIASRFVSNDDLRPSLLDVYYKDQIAATNQHMIYWGDLKTPFEHEVRFPKLVCKLMNIIGGEFEVALHGKNIASCSKDGFVISWRLTEGKFPNFNAVLPKDFKYTIELTVDEVKKIISKIRTYSGVNRLMVFCIDGDEMVLSTEDIDFNNSYTCSVEPVLVKNEIEDGKMEVGINVNFMEEVLRCVEDDTVTIQMSSPSKAVVFNGEFLIMPRSLA